MGARKPTPVDVVFFPKRAGRPVRAGTQTIPEIALTEEVAAADAPVRKRTRSIEQPAQDPLAEMVALGHELFSRGKVNEARVVFEGLVIANPSDAFSHTMLGTIHLARGDLDAGLAAFERALELDPNDIAARVYRGEIRLNRKKLKGAAEDLGWALKLAEAGDPFADRARRLLKLTRRSTR